MSAACLASSSLGTPRAPHRAGRPAQQPSLRVARGEALPHHLGARSIAAIAFVALAGVAREVQLGVAHRARDLAHPRRWLAPARLQNRPPRARSNTRKDPHGAASPATLRETTRLCSAAHEPSPLVSVLFFALLSGSAIGCAPAIGDDCETALDCSSQGSRQCDRTQPAAIAPHGLRARHLPEDSVCVKFRPRSSVSPSPTAWPSASRTTLPRRRRLHLHHRRRVRRRGSRGARQGQRQFCSVPLLMMSPPPEEDASVPDADLPDPSTDDAGNN